MIGIDTTAKMILDHYGQQKQELQAVQELSELILLLAARPDPEGGKEMTPKEYLQQYRHAVERARAALEHLEELQSMATRTTPNYGGEGGGQHQSGDAKLCNAVDKIIQAKNRVSDDLEMLEATEREVVGTIDRVPDQTLSTLLYKRYVNGKTFEQIAVEMNFCYYHIVHRLHPKALKAVKMLLNVTSDV